MPCFSYTRNCRGMALLNMVFIFIFIGVLIGAGLKMYGSIATRGRINDSKSGLENQVRVIVAWAAKNGRLPRGDEYASVFGGTVPLDAWGRPVVYIYDDTQANAAFGLCGRTTTNLQDTNAPGIPFAFALVSEGDDSIFNTTVNGVTVTASPNPYLPVTAASLLANYQGDIYRAVPLEEMKNKAGCYGPTGGRLMILNNELPRGCNNVGLATLYADGGIPFAASPNTYKWCINKNLTDAGFAVSNAMTATDCLAVPDAVWDLQPASSQASIAYKAPSGTYTATVVLRDQQKNSVQRSYQLIVLPTGGSCGSGPSGNDPSIDGEFIRGTTLSFNGNNVSGANASIVLTGNLLKGDINGGAAIAVSNAYISGDVTLGGSQTLGNPTTPGIIYIEGNLDLSGAAGIYGKTIYVRGNITMNGSPFLGLSDNSAVIKALGAISITNGTIYGDIYAGGSMYLKSATLYKNAYVTGNLTLDWTPSFSGTTTVRYKGSLSAPANFDSTLLAKCVKDTSLSAVAIPITMPNTTIPPLKDFSWYTNNGYATSGALTDNIKIFANYSYASNGSASNVVIVSTKGITIGSGNDTISGVIYAPNGQVSFGGGSFTGYVIAKDGFFVTRGGSIVTLNPISTYIPNTADYPFVYPYP